MTKRKWPDILLISVVTFLMLLPSLRFGFVNLDDNFYVTDNVYIRHFSMSNIIYFFTSFHHGVYAPIQYLTYMLLYRISGYHAMAYHLTGIIFHILSGIMVYMVVDEIQHDRITALFSSLLFLVSPVNIDSAVWIAELKNTQSLFFFLSGFYFYTLYRSRNRKSLYACSFIGFILGLLVKAPGATLIIMMFLYDLINSKTMKNSIFNLLPYASASLVFMIIFMIGQATIGSYHGLIGNSLWSNTKTVIAVMAGLPEYPSKLLFPVRLSIAYPLDAIVSNTRFVLSLLIMVFIIIGIKELVKRKEFLLVFWIIWYFANMLPYYGIIAMPFFANWYLYIASIGVYTTLVISINRIDNKKIAYVFLALILLVYGFLGFKRQFVWKNEISMWTSSLHAVGDDTSILMSLSAAYLRNNEPYEGIEYGRKLLSRTPDFVAMKYFIAKAYADTGDYTRAQAMLDEALSQLNKLEKEGHADIAVLPGFGDTPSTLKAMIYFEMAEITLAGNQNHIDQAVALLIKAVDAAPYVPAYEKLAYIYVQTGKVSEARNLLAKLVALKPLDADAWRMLGYITARYYHDQQLAIKYFKKSLELAPEQQYAGEIKLLLESWKTNKQ